MVGMSQWYGIKTGTDHGEAVVQRQRIGLIQPEIEIDGQLGFQWIEPCSQITAVEAAMVFAVGLPETAKQISKRAANSTKTNIETKCRGCSQAVVADLTCLLYTSDAADE